jgi:hypothetical protein
MRVDRECDIRRVAPRLDRQRNLADQLAGIRAHDPATLYPMSFRIKQNLGVAFFAPERQ